MRGDWACIADYDPEGFDLSLALFLVKQDYFVVYDPNSFGAQVGVLVVLICIPRIDPNASRIYLLRILVV
jgi:hypothetical protein